MTVTSVQPDREAQRLLVTAEYDASVEQVWQLWADPRKLERWWGPPEYPSTFTEHDLTEGGRVAYAMTGPDGQRFPGWWRVVSVTPPHELVFDDGFGDPYAPADMPVTRSTVTVTDLGGGRTRMQISCAFPSVEAFDQLREMGMEEGLRLALGQSDALLAA